MPSFSHLKKEEVDLRRDVISNEMVLKMIESMRRYHDFAIAQGVKNKDRYNVRVRQPLEFVEYVEGQKFLKVKRPVSEFKSEDEKKA